MSFYSQWYISVLGTYSIVYSLFCTHIVLNLSHTVDYPPIPSLLYDYVYSKTINNVLFELCK